MMASTNMTMAVRYKLLLILMLAAAMIVPASAVQAGPMPMMAAVEMPAMAPTKSAQARPDDHINGSDEADSSSNNISNNNPIKPDQDTISESKSKADKQRSKERASPHDTSTCTIPLTPQFVKSLQTIQPYSQNFGLQKYHPKKPTISISLPHAAVATHSGYIIFYIWIDEYPESTNVDYSEIEPGYWRRNSVFYMENKDDTDAVIAVSGNTAVVGMPDVNTRYGRLAGVVYTYEYDESADSWAAKDALTPHYFPTKFDSQGKNIINDQTNHAFGATLQLQGNVLVVGAPGIENFVGGVYIFERQPQPKDGSKKHWVQKQQYTPSDLDERCPGAVFGGGLQMHKNLIAVGADCREWMFFYEYHSDNNRLSLIQGPETFARQKEEHLMATVLVTEEYFVYSVFDHGVFIYKKRDDAEYGNVYYEGEENNSTSEPMYPLMQFIDSTPFKDDGFGSHMVMNDESDMLMVCGDFRVFFFALTRIVTYDETAEAAGEELAWELVRTFEIPLPEHGLVFEDGKLLLAGAKHVFSFNIKEEIDTMMAERRKR